MFCEDVISNSISRQYDIYTLGTYQTALGSGSKRRLYTALKIVEHTLHKKGILLHVVDIRTCVHNIYKYTVVVPVQSGVCTSCVTSSVRGRWRGAAGLSVSPA